VLAAAAAAWVLIIIPCVSVIAYYYYYCYYDCRTRYAREMVHARTHGRTRRSPRAVRMYPCGGRRRRTGAEEEQSTAAIRARVASTACVRTCINGNAAAREIAPDAVRDAIRSLRINNVRSDCNLAATADGIPIRRLLAS